MADRKVKRVCVEAKVKIVLHVNKDEEVSHVMDELEYSFSDTTGKAQVEDTEITDYEIINSK